MNGVKLYVEIFILEAEYGDEGPELWRWVERELYGHLSAICEAVLSEYPNAIFQYDRCGVVTVGVPAGEWRPDEDTHVWPQIAEYFGIRGGGIRGGARHE